MDGAALAKRSGAAVEVEAYDRLARTAERSKERFNEEAILDYEKNESKEIVGMKTETLSRAPIDYQVTLMQDVLPLVDSLASRQVVEADGVKGRRVG